MAKKLHATKNDLAVTVREKSIVLLNQLLADTFDLYSQIKHAHWNVKGPHFIALHKLFDELAEEVLDHVDELAERATALGGQALGTVRLAGASSQLSEYPVELTDGLRHVEALSTAFAKVAAATRAAIDTSTANGDATTADLFTQISGDLDKNLWFLESHLQH